MLTEQWAIELKWRNENEWKEENEENPRVKSRSNEKER